MFDLHGDDGSTRAETEHKVAKRTRLQRELQSEQQFLRGRGTIYRRTVAAVTGMVLLAIGVGVAAANTTSVLAWILSGAGAILLLFAFIAWMQATNGDYHS